MAAKPKKSPNKKVSWTPGDVRRLRQLLLCLMLFGLVFAGRGMDLGPVSRLSAFVSEIVGVNTDFQAVFAQMGESFSQGEPAVETFRALIPKRDIQDNQAPCIQKGTSMEPKQGGGDNEST